MADLEEAKAAYNSLTATERTEFERAVVVTPPSNQGGRTAIWVVGLLILGGALFVFGYLAFASSSEGARTAFLAVATTALGLLGGIFAPSPVANSKI